METDSKCLLGELSQFQQVWLLMGSPADKDDVAVSSPFFSSLKLRLKDFVALGGGRGVFVGAGLGNTDHANGISHILFPSLPVGARLLRPTQWQEVGTVPFPNEFEVTFKRQNLLPQGPGVGPLLFGRFESLHSLFDGLKFLTDYDRTSQANRCSSDEIVHPGLKRGAGLLAVDACGQATVAAFQDSKTRIVVDANMARFYGTNPEDWFNRIVNWLSGWGN
jgi:hypothetical protein